MLAFVEDLIGLKEIATLLGVSRQRALQIVRDRPEFPEPVARLASGRVWRTEAVQTWVAEHPDRRPGRPRKQSPEVAE